MIDQKNLELLLNSHFPIIVVETHEEQRAIQLLQLVLSLSERGLYSWSVTEGLKRLLSGSMSNYFMDKVKLSKQEDEQRPTDDPEAALQQINDGIQDSVIVMLDFHPYMREPVITRRLKELAMDHYVSGNTLVLISHNLEIPPELKKLCAHLELSLPDAKRLRELVVEEAKAFAKKRGNGRVKADSKALEMLVTNLLGMTISDAKRLIRNAIYDDGAITHDDLKGVMEAKYQLVGQDGALHFEYDTATFADVGGFDQLKEWLNLRREPFLKDTADDPDHPSGILLTGVQGSGKSLAAKAVAGSWGVPLLRLDVGGLYNKFIGETEKNLRDTLKAAEIMAPCILWVDEIEKGMATGEGDNSTSQRLLASLLTWMAEKKERVFIVATANNIHSLPPELVRKGRLDEIFFVDLPTLPIREVILRTHLNKRKVPCDDIDLRALADHSDGFSGAELEQVVVAARYAAASNGGDISTEMLMEEIKRTQPLSVVMAEQINALRQWADGRTVPVH